MTAQPSLTTAVNGTTLAFYTVELNFEDRLYSNIFTHKNNKTLGETLAHKRYTKLAQTLKSKYQANLHQPLGTFLLGLKQAGDLFYLNFLNKYGDSSFCSFAIDDPRYLISKGLYAYTVNGAVKYIGRCLDNFNKRINQGYGRIHPKNCYIDGQVTNCHLNSLIAPLKSNISFYICPLQSDNQIKYYEELLITTYQPEWNITLKG